MTAFATISSLVIRTDFHLLFSSQLFAYAVVYAAYANESMDAWAFGYMRVDDDISISSVGVKP